MIQEIDNIHFEQKILNVSKPSIVLVHSPICSNCKSLILEFEKIAIDHCEFINFWHFQSQQESRLLKKYKVIAVPTLLFIHHGKLLDKGTGAISSRKIKKRLKRLNEYSTRTLG